MGGEVQLPEPSHSARVGLRWGHGCCSAFSWGCVLVSGGSFSLWALRSGCFRGEPWSGGGGREFLRRHAAGASRLSVTWVSLRCRLRGSRAFKGGFSRLLMACERV